jgi:hypothetical protein
MELEKTYKTESVELIGFCAVDSGQIMITDPGYTNGWGSEGFGEIVPEGHYSYAGACDLTLSKKSAGQLNFPAGHAGMGVVASSGYGDGYYPVYATYYHEYADEACTKQVDKRIAKLEIVFIDDYEGED